MTKAKPPVKEARDWNVVCSALLIDCIHFFSMVFLIISGLEIIWIYIHLVMGWSLALTYQPLMNYSITIFAGTALYLLGYTYNLEKIIKRMFSVKEIKPLSETN